ncbi:MAG: nucleoside hydrolase [Candidatus Puniceispirillum sp.]|nr:nucleoside hydrolase [Candidatus Puniceispirillum sp.]
MRSIILDCDPGGDDAVALLMALSAPNILELKGVTTISGNASLEWIHTNARKICELANRRDVRVFAGCSNALLRPAVNASFCHGNDGLAGASLPMPTMPLEKQHAVDFLIQSLEEAKEPLTLAMTAPITNLAIALCKAPHIADLIKEVVWMGGAVGTGNITPAAEFNAYVDPHALAVVLSRKVPLRMIGLNITHQVTTSTPWMARLRAQGTNVARQVAGILEVEAEADKARYNLGGRAIHDACVIASLLRPELFTWAPASISVSTEDNASLGATLVSTYPCHLDEAPHTCVATQVDAHGVLELILSCMAFYRQEDQKQVVGF